MMRQRRIDARRIIQRRWDTAGMRQSRGTPIQEVTQIG